MKKTTKIELMSALALLIVAAVMMTSASFAWYTISKQADISGVNVKLQATQNVEICLVSRSATAVLVPTEVQAGQGSNQYAWGGTLKFESEIKLDLPATAASIDGDAGIYTLTYSDSGRGNTLVKAVVGSPDSEGVQYYTANILNAVNTSGPAADGSYEDADKTSTGAMTKKVAAVFDCFVRTNVGVSGSKNMELTVSCGSLSNATCQVFVGSDKVTDENLVLFDEDNDYATPYANGSKWEIDADKPTEVRIVVFFNGDAIKAADVDADLSLTGVDIRFNNPLIDAD